MAMVLKHSGLNHVCLTTPTVPLLHTTLKASSYLVIFGALVTVVWESLLYII